MTLVFEPPFRQRSWRYTKRKRSTYEGEEDHVSFEAEKEIAESTARIKSPNTSPRQRSKSKRSSRQPERHSNLKYQHFASLNAALYKSVLEHNFDQASRIFGVLLRFNPPGVFPAGSHVDIRKQNLWGIGAEILLQRAEASRTADHRIDTLRRPSLPLKTGLISSEQGFEDTRMFFERLILQYPPKRQHSFDRNDEVKEDLHGNEIEPPVTAAKIYPILFSLWILQIQGQICERQMALDQLLATYQYPDDDAQTELDQMCDTNANAIRPLIERIDEVVRAPPYDQQHDLLRMQEETRNWLAVILLKSSKRSRDSTKSRQRAGGLSAGENTPDDH